MSASFHEVQFPPTISLGAVGGPGFKTIITEMSGGDEKRNISWAESRATYDVSQGLKTQDDIDALKRFGYDYIYHTRFSLESDEGLSDVLAARISDRRQVLIECKRERKDGTDPQLYCLEVFRLIGKTETYMCWPSNREEVIEILR